MVGRNIESEKRNEGRRSSMGSEWNEESWRDGGYDERWIACARRLEK
jgi:hypothetical protein